MSSWGLHPNIAPRLLKFFCCCDDHTVLRLFSPQIGGWLGEESSRDEWLSSQIIRWDTRKWVAFDFILVQQGGHLKASLATCKPNLHIYPSNTHHINIIHRERGGERERDNIKVRKKKGVQLAFVSTTT